MKRHGLFLFLLLGSCSIAGAATNPVPADFPLRFIYNETAYLTQVTEETGDGYLLSNSGWDNCYTHVADNKYEHVHCGFDYPTMAYPSGITVTLGMAKGYWDIYYTGYSYIGSTTLKYNCHGYSTGYLHWVQANSDGMGTVLDDDYWEANELWPEVGFVALNAYGLSHSLLITATVWLDPPCDSHPWVKSLCEKRGGSGIYQFTYPVGNLLAECYEKIDP